MRAGRRTYPTQANLKESQNAVETKNSQLEELRKSYEASQVENEEKMSGISKLTTCPKIRNSYVNFEYRTANLSLANTL